MLTSAYANFVIVGADTATPTYFWRGLPLTEVLRLTADLDEDGARHIKMRVHNTANFDAAYTEMIAAGILVKKVSV